MDDVNRAALGGVLPQSVGLPLVYVDYLATAPWNLPGLVASPRFTRCGAALVWTALRYSVSLGLAGRLGLHSLQGAEGFYRDKLKMTDMGIDPAYENLRYFEMTEAGATVYLNKGKAI